MTTIKSVYSKLAEYTRTLDISDHAGGKNLFVRAGSTKLGITVEAADLLAALDATANTDVAGMRRDLIVAENAADEWKARAEKAEADHEDTKAAYRALGASHAELLTRAEKAEAALARVEAVIDGIGRNSVFAHEVRNAIKPGPALPSHDGALIVATFTIGSRTHTDVPIRRKGGVWSSLDDTKHLRSEVIESWKPARVVAEAES